MATVKKVYMFKLLQNVKYRNMGIIYCAHKNACRIRAMYLPQNEGAGEGADGEGADEEADEGASVRQARGQTTREHVMDCACKQMTEQKRE